MEANLDRDFFFASWAPSIPHPATSVEAVVFILGSKDPERDYLRIHREPDWNRMAEEAGTTADMLREEPRAEEDIRGCQFRGSDAGGHPLAGLSSGYRHWWWCGRWCGITASYRGVAMRAGDRADVGADGARATALDIERLKAAQGELGR